MLYWFLIRTPLGIRSWQAEDEDHAREQHIDAFGVDDPDEVIIAAWRA
jgi:hypothetical protein